MSRTHTASAAALLLTTGLFLAGCAGASDPAESAPADDTTSTADAGASATPEPSEPEVEAATGETITGTGYSYTVPEGWGDPQQEFPGVEPDTFAADLGDTDGFADNINVFVSPAGQEVPVDQIESAAQAELEGAGATDVTVNDRVTVAGNDTAHISAGFTQDSVSYVVHQFYVTGGGETYVVTFSFSPEVPEADQLQTAQSVLATWTFA